VIETERLLLRPWRDVDLEPFHTLCTDRRVMRYLGPPQSRGLVAAAIARQRKFQADLGYCFWPVERKSDGSFLGFCGVKPGAEDTPIRGCIEIGWRLRADCWGHSYAREAAQASLDWAWANIDTTQVVAITNIGNTRSWGLMERLGMRRDPEGDFDHPAVPLGDPLRPHILYRIRRPR
jgi:RimJ/RimL family protein N-acetyltransferase